MIEKRKVVLIGTGFVGMSMAYSLLNQGGVDELVLIDVNKDKTIGEEMDLSHGLPYAPHRMKIKAGSYKDCKNANDSDDVCDFHKDVSILCEHLIKYIEEYN